MRHVKEWLCYTAHGVRIGAIVRLHTMNPPLLALTFVMELVLDTVAGATGSYSEPSSLLLDKDAGLFGLLIGAPVSKLLLSVFVHQKEQDLWYTHIQNGTNH